MSYDHVKDRTSAAVGSEDGGGILFDETIAAYSARGLPGKALMTSSTL